MKKDKQFKYRRFNSSKLLAVIGLLVIVLCVTTVIFWETGGREHFLYEDIIVSINSIDKDTVITEDMLINKSIDSSQIIEGTIRHKNEIIGKRAAHFIPGQSQLNLAYFLDESIELSEGEYILAIPDDWIITMPESLRGGDEIYFYPVKQKEKSEEDVSGNTGFSNSTISSSMKAEIFKKEDILRSVVAYIKDSGNREVVTISKEERFDGSSKIASLEIIVNLEDIAYLQGHADDNYKFIILYKDIQV